MNNKKLGLVFLAISIVLAAILVSMTSSLTEQAQELGCFSGETCAEVEASLSITHFVFGFVGFILALGFYLVFFAKGEEEILRRLEETKNKQLADEKFALVSKALDEYERKVLKAVKDQDGITQATLRLRTDMSKAKLSAVLDALEKKGLVAKEKQGKTHTVHLKDSF